MDGFDTWNPNNQWKKDILEMNKTIDKTKIWAKAETIKPIQAQYCSDTTKYHTMVIPRGAVVSVGKMPPDSAGKDQWCVVQTRTKGYHVCGLIGSDLAKQCLKSLRNINGVLEYETQANHAKMCSVVINTLQSGVHVVGKKLNPSNVPDSTIKQFKAHMQ